MSQYFHSFLPEGSFCSADHAGDRKPPCYYVACSSDLLLLCFLPPFFLLLFRAPYHRKAAIWQTAALFRKNSACYRQSCLAWGKSGVPVVVGNLWWWCSLKAVQEVNLLKQARKETCDAYICQLSETCRRPETSYSTSPLVRSAIDPYVRMYTRTKICTQKACLWQSRWRVSLIEKSLFPKHTDSISMHPRPPMLLSLTSLAPYPVWGGAIGFISTVQPKHTKIEFMWLCDVQGQPIQRIWPAENYLAQIAVWLSWHVPNFTEPAGSTQPSYQRFLNAVANRFYFDLPPFLLSETLRPFILCPHSHDNMATVPYWFFANEHPW